jgi:hypothetical protein
MRKLSLIILFSLVALGLVGPVQARVTIGIPLASKIIVPAERTTMLGFANDGRVRVPGFINWTNGANYVNTNLLEGYLAEQDDVTLTGNWVYSVDGSGALPRLYTNAAGDYTIVAQLDTSVPNGNGITVIAPAGTVGVDLSALDDVPTSYHFFGRCRTSGGINVDPQPAAAATNVLVQTLYQFSNANAGGAVTSTVDAIGNQALLFLGGTISNAHSFVVASTNVFSPTIRFAPTFQTGDQLLLTLGGANAFQGLAAVVFTGGGNAVTRGVGAATNSKTFTFSAADMWTLMGGGTPGQAGPGGNIRFNIAFVSAGTAELDNRTISANDVSLDLSATGNGVRSLGSYGQVAVFVQNGTLFRLGRARMADSQNWFVRFASSAGNPVTIDVQYYEEDGTGTGWQRWASTIPTGGSLALSKDAIMTALGLTTANLDGYVQFRLSTAPQNVVATCQAQHVTQQAWFNVPMYYLSGLIWR